MPTNPEQSDMLANVEEIFLNLGKVKGDNYVMVLQILVNQFTFFRLSKKLDAADLNKAGAAIIATSIELFARILKEETTDSLELDYTSLLEKIYGRNN